MKSNPDMYCNYGKVASGSTQSDNGYRFNVTTSIALWWNNDDWEQCMQDLTQYKVAKWRCEAAAPFVMEVQNQLCQQEEAMSPDNFVIYSTNTCIKTLFYEFRAEENLGDGKKTWCYSLNLLNCKKIKTRMNWKSEACLWSNKDRMLSDNVVVKRWS